MPGPRCAGGRVRSRCRASAAAKHGGDARHQGLFNLLRADKMYVCINPPRSEDLSFTGNHLGARPDDNIDAILHIGVATFTDGGNATLFNTHIGFNNAPVIENQGIGNQGIDCFSTQPLALTHAVSNHLATAKLHFIAVAGVIFFDFDKKFGVTQTHPVANGGAVHLRIGVAVYF